MPSLELQLFTSCKLWGGKNHRTPEIVSWYNHLAPVKSSLQQSCWQCTLKESPHPLENWSVLSAHGGSHITLFTSTHERLLCQAQWQTLDIQQWTCFHGAYRTTTRLKKKKIRAREIDYNIVSLGVVWGAERVAVGSVKGVQSRFGEPERTLRGNEASLWLDRDKRLKTGNEKGNSRPGHRKNRLKMQEVKMQIFEKINKIDKTGKTDQVKKKEWGEH